MWIPPEDKDPIVKHAPTRKSTSMFGAVNTRSGKFVYMKSSVFNAETFRQFMTVLKEKRAKGKRMFIILDNARYHHAMMLRQFLEMHKDKITLLFLPPYSPELNPIERVWKLTRRLATHNQYFPTMEELVCKVSERMNMWERPNPELQKLCCI